MNEKIPFIPKNFQGYISGKPEQRVTALEKVSDEMEARRVIFLANCERELQRRKEDQSRILNLPDYVSRPVDFVQDVVRETPWSKQREIMNGLITHRRIAVPSCHDSGKSYTASRIAAWWLSCHDQGDAFVVTTAPTTAQVKAILWREINKCHTRGKLPGRTNQVEWYIGNELVGFGRKPDDMDLSAFQGIHARYVLVILDEAGGVVKQLWDAADTLITNENSRILAIGNPDDPTSHFATVCKAGSGWKVMPISAYDTPNFTGEEVPDKVREVLVSKLWVDEKRQSWGEGSPLFVAKVLGQFPDVGEDTLIGPGLVQAAVNCTLAKDEETIELGLDVARYGHDSSVLYGRWGRCFKLVGRMLGQDTMKVAGMAVRGIRETRATAIKIDDIGVGGGVVDRLLELQREERTKMQSRQNDYDDALVNCKIIGVNVGRAPSTKTMAKTFHNLRAEIYWYVRDMFRLHEIDIPDDDKTASQLGAIKYEVRSNGKIIIESKDDMKDRGMPSPDEADALVLCAAPAKIFELPDWLNRKIVSPPIAIYAV